MGRHDWGNEGGGRDPKNERKCWVVGEGLGECWLLNMNVGCGKVDEWLFHGGDGPGGRKKVIWPQKGVQA